MSKQKPKTELNDYLDLQLIESLAPAQRHLMIKLLNSDSSHIDKFLTKIASNQIQINHDMLAKMSGTLKHQMSLPIQIIHQQPRFELKQSLFESLELKHWQDLQSQLRIWGNFDFQIISHYLSVTNYYIAQDLEPEFVVDKTPGFWSAKNSENAMMLMVKFIYEKFKYFHAELLPHSKRPMDLFELFCPLEDAALELKLIYYNDDQLEFLRSLNASALLYSVIQDFTPAIPDLLAMQLKLFQYDASHPFWQHFFNGVKYEPIYGPHPYLQEVGRQAWFAGLKLIMTYFEKNHHCATDIMQHANDNSPIIQALQTHLQYQSQRLIFIFNRMTSLGFLLRSPIFKGMGYQPLIHTEAPLRLFTNFLHFIQQYQTHNAETQSLILENLNINQEYSTLKIN